MSDELPAQNLARKSLHNLEVRERPAHGALNAAGQTRCCYESAESTSDGAQKQPDHLSAQLAAGLCISLC